MVGMMKVKSNKPTNTVKTMKISIKNYLTMAALTLAGAIMAGCSSSDDGIDTPPQPENTGKVVTLTTTVSLDGGGADTRALTAGGVKTFAAGETMALVYRSMSKKWAVKESEPLGAGDIAEGGKSATFTFNLTEEPDKTVSVYYIYPAAMATADGNENDEALCTEQDGTLAKLASNFDLATTHNNLDWDGDNLPGATLENQLAILAITLKDDATDADITGSITSLILSVDDGTYTYNVSRSAVAGPIYVAIHPTRNATIDVTATGGGYTYTKTLTYKIYQASNGYNVSWRMTDVTPLTMEALTAGNIVVDNPRSGMLYSKNGGAKTAVTSDAIDVEAGDKVQFYGNSAAYYSNEADYTSITGSGDGFKCKVYGNIMSLVDETGFATATTLTSENENTFRRLFYNNTTLTDASGLLLPATTLTESCYFAMFHGCSSLTTAPAALPAETLASNCYNGMFRGCTSLTTAPELPATTLASSCYQGMFNSCKSLTTAPELPAKTLANSCYSYMFNGCTKLSAAPAVLPATTLAQDCYQRMFSDCKSLTIAPVLPATTLVNNCYSYMFDSCTRLSAVTCLTTTPIVNYSANLYTEDWLKGAGTQAEGTKTFTTPSTTKWTTGTSGIPSGWTRLNPDGSPYVAP